MKTNTIEQENYYPEMMENQKPFSVILTDDNGEQETLWMHYQEKELKDSLEQLGVTEESQFCNVSITLGDHTFTSSLTELIEGENFTMENLSHLNQLGKFLQDDFGNKCEQLANLIDATQITTLEELSVLMDNYHEIELSEDNMDLVTYNGADPEMFEIIDNMEQQSQSMGGMQ